MKTGDVIRMTSFTHVTPNMRVTFRAPKKQVAVFVLLGEENADGTAPLDLEDQMNKLGWIRAPQFRPRKRKGG